MNLDDSATQQFLKLICSDHSNASANMNLPDEINNYFMEDMRSIWGRN